MEKPSESGKQCLISVSDNMAAQLASRSLALTTYKTLRRIGPADDLKKFEDWVLGLGKGDNKNGLMALTELKEQYDKGLQTKDSIYQTLIMFDTAAGEPIATVTVYPDNETLWKYLPEDIKSATDAYTGFLQVHRDRRGEGFSEIMLDLMDSYLQQQAQKVGKPLQTLSCTWHPAVIHMYEKRGGYKFAGTVEVPEWRVTENLYFRTHTIEGLELRPGVPGRKPEGPPEVM